jgi:hypothetical protein
MRETVGLGSDMTLLKKGRPPADGSGSKFYPMARIMKKTGCAEAEEKDERGDGGVEWSSAP